ncbi:TOM1-like protein 2 [Homalodisca vitripennis]|nr:TOM1-like protein 2 [Homalodisca vitripennis]
MSMRGREALGAAAGAAAGAVVGAPGQSLIDLSDDATPPTSQMASLSLKGASAVVPTRHDKDDSEFDMFAQSRNVTYESSKNGGSSTYEANLKPDQISGSLGAVAQSRSQTQTADSYIKKKADQKPFDFTKLSHSAIVAQLLACNWLYKTSLDCPEIQGL